MKILERLRLQEQLKNMAATSTGGSSDPKLKKQLEEKNKQLNSILNKWTFGDKKIKTSEEFINKFEGWINEQLDKQKDLKVFLSKWGSTSLNQLETTWKDIEEDYKEQIRELKNKGTGELSEELKEKLKEYDNLEIERDELRRDKKTLEQDNIAINNRLKLKQEEVNNKDKEIDRIKKEASKKEKDLNEKYQKKVKQLDTEQLECKKLEEENEKLQGKIKELEKERKELLKEKHGDGYADL